MFEHSKNPKPIFVDEDVHVSNPKNQIKTFNINMNHKFLDV